MVINEDDDDEGMFATIMNDEKFIVGLFLGIRQPWEFNFLVMKGEIV